MSQFTDGMTLEEQIGQLLMVGFPATTPSEAVLDLIQRYHVGNIILFSRNIGDAEQLRALTRDLQAAAKEVGQRYPLLIAVDQENGIVQRLGQAATIFPGNMTLGAISSEDIAYRVARASGEELRELGINMNLAPVVDVNNNPANPVIGVRSFGEDAELVARLGAAMVHGYQDAGILACLKHFPGHGDTAVDSHLALPTIPYTLERLETLELMPFKRGIEAGAKSVMIAHIAFPALTGRDDLPATLSPVIVRGLLRGQLGFTGLIISDCLEMHAIADTFGTERAAVLALQAGNDIVLVSHHNTLQRSSLEAIRAAVQSGELSEEMIRQAAERVLRHKANLNANGTHFAKPSIPDAQSLQQQAYALSTTLVRDDNRLLPLQLAEGERVFVVALPRNSATMVEDRTFSDATLLDILASYGVPVQTLSITRDMTEQAFEELLRTTGDHDVFVVATVNAHLDRQQAAFARSLATQRKRVIGIAARNPYDTQALPEIGTYLATYEYTRPALEAAVRVIFGK